MPRGKALSDERFVGLIQERPFIYDVSDNSHMDQQKINNLWESVTRTLRIEGIDGKFEFDYVFPHAQVFEIICCRPSAADDSQL